MSIFADDHEDLLDFGDGCQVAIRREMTAGMQVDIQRELVRMAGEGRGKDECELEAYLLTVEAMTTRIITPEGEEHATREALRRLRPDVLRRVHEEVLARITPLAAGSTSEPTSTSGG